MIDTAEKILSQLAANMIKSGWTVRDVFGQPPELLKTIKDKNKKEIQVISPQHFLGRVYQTGIESLSELQIACLIRVIGKPELNDVVKYTELEMLLENFGVLKEQTPKSKDDVNSLRLEKGEDSQ